MNFEKHFHRNISKARKLSQQGFVEEAYKVIEDAEFYLERMKDYTFRQSVLSRILYDHACSTFFNKNNKLFYEEIAKENFFHQTACNMKFLSMANELKLKKARFNNISAKAANHFYNKDFDMAENLLCNTLQNDSIAAPYIEKQWREYVKKIDLNKLNKKRNSLAWILLNLNNVTSQTSLKYAKTLIHSKGHLLVANAEKGIEIINPEGFISKKIDNIVIQSQGCIDENENAWFIGNNELYCIDANKGVIKKIKVLDCTKYFKNIIIRNLAFQNGMIWFSYSIRNKKFEGKILAVNANTGKIEEYYSLNDSIPFIASIQNEILILNAFSCRIDILGSEHSQYIQLPQNIFRSLPIFFFFLNNQIWIADSTTIAVFSEQGLLMGRLQIPDVLGYYTNIAGLTLSPCGSIINIIDFIYKRLIHIKVNPIYY